MNNKKTFFIVVAVVLAVALLGENQGWWDLIPS